MGKQDVDNVDVFFKVLNNELKIYIYSEMDGQN